jgi:hypothetical protein
MGYGYDELVQYIELMQIMVIVSGEISRTAKKPEQDFSRGKCDVRLSVWLCLCQQDKGRSHWCSQITVTNDCYSQKTQAAQHPQLPFPDYRLDHHLPK